MPEPLATGRYKLSRCGPEGTGIANGPTVNRQDTKGAVSLPLHGIEPMKRMLNLWQWSRSRWGRWCSGFLLALSLTLASASLVPLLAQDAGGPSFPRVTRPRESFCPPLGPVPGAIAYRGPRRNPTGDRRWV